jgi:hypothetical protein
MNREETKMSAQRTKQHLWGWGMSAPPMVALFVTATLWAGFDLRSMDHQVPGGEAGEPLCAPGQDAPGPFKPVPLPDPHIPGFVFPEKETTIVGWAKDNNLHAINKHAWGIWTALTLPSGESFEGQALRVFETWYTPQDILGLPAGGRLLAVPREPLPLEMPRQLQRRVKAAAPGGGEPTVTGFVKYDPTAAEFIVENKLLSKKALNELLKQGKKSVPDFPNTAVSLKPVFHVVTGSQLVQGRYYQLAAWPGPPNPPKPFPSNEWGQCVWVDVKDPGDGMGSGKVDTKCSADGSSRTPETTYGLGGFIHFRLSAARAKMLNAARAATEKKLPAVAEGDYAILLGMHVTSREITRWTWQTFWWAQDPDNPPLPSSREIAADRPAELKGAPRHYAHASSYSMVFPPQPNTGGSNTGDSVYAYNPWLEAPFAPTDLPASRPGQYQGKPVANNVGVQTNCMSCHAQASYSAQGIDLTATLYTGDQYIDLEGPQFKGNLQVDFLWSIADRAK